jgi:hypothetical protein
MTDREGEKGSWVVVNLQSKKGTRVLMKGKNWRGSFKSKKWARV